MEPLFISFTGPSGSGKSTLIDQLILKHDSATRIPSVTTRHHRHDDRRGEYIYVSPLRFELMEKRGLFAWTAMYAGLHYATQRSALDRILSALGNPREKPLIGLYALTPSGVENLQKYLSEKKTHDGGDLVHLHIPFFLIPPDGDVLRARLEKRGDTEEEIIRRVEDAKNWRRDAEASPYEYVYIDNRGSIESALEQVLTAIP